MGRTWRLHNIDTGDDSMQAGRMDVSFTDAGGVEERAEPEDVLAQRIEKSSVEPQGSNAFLSGWGSTFAKLLGEKLVPEQLARETGAGLRIMLAALVSEQQRVRLRIALDPRELISRLVNSSIFTDTSSLIVSAVIATEGNTSSTPTAVVR